MYTSPTSVPSSSSFFQDTLNFINVHISPVCLSHAHISNSIILAQTRQMYSLIITTIPPTRHITPRLQRHIKVPTPTRILSRTKKPVQLPPIATSTLSGQHNDCDGEFCTKHAVEGVGSAHDICTFATDIEILPKLLRTGG
jgi:hypothetical protein